jgi:hypothetical protein
MLLHPFTFHQGQYSNRWPFIFDVAAVHNDAPTLYGRVQVRQGQDSRYWIKKHVYSILKTILN